MLFTPIVHASQRTCSTHTYCTCITSRTCTNARSNATPQHPMVQMLSGADMDVVAQSSQPGAALVLAIVYQVVMCMVLLNVLMGVMMNAVTKVDENQDVLHYCSKAAVTDELESTMPPFMVGHDEVVVIACIVQLYYCTVVCCRVWIMEYD